MSEEIKLLSPPAECAQLQAALAKSQADYGRLSEIVASQRRVNQRLRQAGLSQSREIVRLQEQLKGRGEGNGDRSCDAVTNGPGVAHRLALAQSREIVRLRNQLKSHGLEPMVEV